MSEAELDWEDCEDWGSGTKYQDFKSGTKIPLENGGQVTVKKKLGEGGQGAVYLVDYSGKEYALRWYTKRPPDKFKKNLDNNISKGKPNDAFLWPEILTQDFDGSFGYLMMLRPSEYKDFSQFLMAKARFENLSAMFNAAKQISNGIAELHRSGYYFPDLSDGNICINPSNGDVLFDGTDNIVRFGEKTGILGKARYMAPEIVRGESTPDIYSDLFALSVILFLLILGNHPLEGLLISQITCMTETIEKELYGTNPLFIYDKNDVSNRPVQNLHNNVIKRWAVFPVILKEPFHKAFDKASMTVLSSCKNRITADEWVDVITSVQNSLVYCPSCKHKTFSENSECIMCGGKLS